MAFTSLPIATADSALTGVDGVAALQKAHDMPSAADVTASVVKTQNMPLSNNLDSTVLSLPNIKWDRATFDAAITAEACTVTFVGTSITEGWVAQAENSNTWVNRFKRTLARSYPNVDFTFINLGLSSRQLSDYVDTGYLGLASEPANARAGYYRAANSDAWPSGSTVGQSWKAAAEATAPDLFIIDMGMNDTTDIDTYSTNLAATITQSRTWAKSPSIALVSSMLKRADQSTYENVRNYSNITRFTAISMSCGIIDVGALWNHAVRGELVLDSVFQRQNSISDWQQAGTVTTLTDNSFSSSSGGYIFKFGNYTGGRVAANFSPTGGTSNYSCYFNLEDGDTAVAGELIWVIRFNSEISIYNKQGSKLIAFATGAAVTGAVAEFIDIRVDKNLVQIYINNVFIGRYIMSKTKGFGGLGMRVFNNSSASNIVVDLAETVTASPIFTELELLGDTTAAAGWNVGDYSKGGNSINHPSRLALKEIYQRAINAFVSRL
jgi:lysophospholipase L1-like esterase